ncbi:Ltp family lipoprotein [Brachybacterium sp. MASK1Z-5]|uniref:Ltp family lipoprotein n=1 Tax=Brachybacterium halotolerans TaxID=2795215 RepID=A0ABS1B7L0_9MICO|nr:Ltp family lipoprotein [Brachybacterium halotolerans]MBK0330585.1 Ltp family lipoprotein [Brachybacterium halotolerans]
MTSTPPPGNPGSPNSGVPGPDSAGGFDAAGSAPQYGSASQPPQFGSPSQAPQYGSPSQAPRYDGDSQGSPYDAPSQAPQFGAAPQSPGQGQEPPKTSKTLWWVLGGCGCLALLAIATVVLVVVLIVNNAGDDDSTPATDPATSSSTDDGTSDEPTDSPTPSDRTVDATPDDDSSADDGTDVDPDDKDAALGDAKTQSDFLYSSKKGIHDTLVFEGYSEETATYAVDHLDADWNKNALEKAKLYKETGGMSDDDIHEQLTSEYGEQFTKEQADYAIKHLHD